MTQSSSNEKRRISILVHQIDIKGRGALPLVQAMLQFNAVILSNVKEYVWKWGEFDWIHWITEDDNSLTSHFDDFVTVEDDDYEEKVFHKHGPRTICCTTQLKKF